MLSKCHRCPHRSPPPYAGVCLCLHDPKNPVDIIERSASRYCPAGKFKLGLGDLIARVLHFTRLNRLKPRKHCGCKDRQLWLNRVSQWSVTKWKALRLKIAP